jgi:hypothetical protein
MVPLPWALALALARWESSKIDRKYGRVAVIPDPPAMRRIDEKVEGWNRAGKWLP